MSRSDRIELPATSDAGLALAISRYRQEALAEAYRRHGGVVSSTNPPVVAGTPS